MSIKETKRKILAQKVLCSLLAAGVMSVVLPACTWAAEQTVDYGNVNKEGGRRVIYVPLTETATLEITNDNDSGVTTVKDKTIAITYTGSKDVPTVQARTDGTLTTYPALNILTQDGLSITGAYCSVGAQNGAVNLASSNGNVVLDTTFTSNAALADGKTAAEHLSDKAYSTIYARNLFGAGKVKVSGKNVSVFDC